MPGYYDPWTVFGSFLIACLAGFVGFESVDHTRYSARPKLWAFIGGVSLGLGIWSMHFIGMLGWHPPFPLFYAIEPTLISVVAAIAASCLALHLVSRSDDATSLTNRGIGALLVGSGICAMHYIGMSALSFSQEVMWSRRWLLISFLIAVSASAGAMALFERTGARINTLGRQLGASVVIGIAICGMHYSGMRAFMLRAGAVSIDRAWSFSGPELARVGVGNAMLFTLALLIVSYRDKARWAQMATEARFQAQESARKLEGMAAAGKIAASVAHEINNPLEAVTNLLYLVQSGEVGELEQDYLRTAQEELKRIAAITAHTLRFYRQQSSPGPTSIPELFDSALMLFQAPITASSIHVERHWPDEVPCIVCRQGEIRQVIANLVSNAIDVMPQGGTLKLSIEPEADGLNIEIADTGPGIPPDLRDKVLEAFFTTKGMAGTGLGLSISAEIISRHGGTLTFFSPGAAPDAGTCFQVFLPFDAPLSAHETRASAVPETATA